MYGPWWVRLSLVVVFGYVSYATPGSDGWPWGVDQWLWTGLRDLPLSWVKYLPLATAGAMVVADLAGAILPTPRIRVRRPLLWALVLSFLCGVWFLSFRVRIWYGDLHGVDQWPMPRWKLETAEPLGALTWHYTMHWAEPLGLLPSEALQLVAVVGGMLGVAAMCFWTFGLTAAWPLPLLMLLTGGFTVLFYGYPEKGTPKALPLLCWYVYAGWRALQTGSRGWSAASSFLLALASLMHGGALSFFPAHVWCLWRRARMGVLVPSVAAFLLPILAVLAYAWSGAPYTGGKWGNVAAPLQWIKAYCITNCGYDFFSWRHLRDVVNCLLVLAPVATLCLPEALAHARRADKVTQWLALGSLGFLFLSSTWFPVFGYISDWDIFAFTPYVVSCFTLYVALQQLPEVRFRRLAGMWVVSNVVHTFSFWRFFQYHF